MSESEESKNERSLVQVLDLSQWGRSKQWASKASGGKMSRITILINEAPPRVSGNKETRPLTFWEHGNKNKNKINHKSGNTRTKACFREQGTPKSKKYF